MCNTVLFFVPMGHNTDLYTVKVSTLLSDTLKCRTTNTKKQMILSRDPLDIAHLRSHLLNLLRNSSTKRRHGRLQKTSNDIRRGRIPEASSVQ